MSNVGDSIHAMNADWSFAGATSEAFDRHVEKSVPFYHEGHDLVAKLSDFFVSDDSLCYEIGSSTGQLLNQLATRHASKKARYVGIEVEPDMIKQAEAKTADKPSVSYLEADILDVDLEPADIIVSYYTCQFIKPKHRQTVFDKIYQSLNWGGAFVLFEKVRACDARFQDLTTAVYTDFKIDQGYAAEEIVGKSRSLKGVLEPFSTQGNLDLLSRAGFVDVMTVFKYVCFEGFLAIK